MSRTRQAVPIGAAMMVATVVLLTGCAATLREQAMIPCIEKPWWTIAGDPDLGAYTDPKQQPVDFGIWQAADGTWELWSCIRNTKCGGQTRLFYRWQGQHLTDPNWQPMGIAMQADPRFGETPGGMQAPHVVRIGDTYYMAYGDWVHICMARSKDGKTFERWLYPNGVAGMFDEGPKANARDAMLLKVGDTWHCYYTAFPGMKGAVYCRTTSDFRQWRDSKIVGSGGRTGNGPCSAECPHVVHHAGYYYLFRTQRYGEDAQTTVYRSKDPMDFGVNDDHYFLCELPVAAPEIIQHNGEYFIASLLPSLKGIQIARLTWKPDASGDSSAEGDAACAAQTQPPDASFLKNCAFVCVDIQPGRYAPFTQDKMPKSWKNAGFTAEDVDAAGKFFHEVAIPNAVRVADACRKLRLPMVFIHWGCRFKDGMDLDPEIRQSFLAEYGKDYDKWPHHASADDSQVHPALQVRDGEYVLAKTGQDAFTSCNLEFVLRNLGAKNLVFVGGHTGACLGKTAASAHRLGFTTLVVEDATCDARESARIPNLEATGYDYIVTADEFLKLAASARQ